MGVNSSTILNASDAITNLTFHEYVASIQPLFIFIIGITIYGVFVFKFYRSLATRDLLKFELHQYSASFGESIKNIAKKTLHSIELFIVVPILIFIWFAVLATLLLLLSKEQSLQTIVLISFAIIATVRITAYYNEDLSKDLAKMIPFALLGVFLIDINFFSLESAFNGIQQIGSLFKTLIYYFVFVIALEFVLRTVYWVYTSFFESA